MANAVQYTRLILIDSDKEKRRGISYEKTGEYIIKALEFYKEYRKTH